MKKTCFPIIAAIFAVLFVAGCGDKDDGSGAGEITIPDNPPAASGGELTKTGGEAVTKTNLSDFIKVFCAAMDYDYWDYDYGSAVRGLPEEYEEGTESGKGSRTRYGKFYGRVEITEAYNYKWKETKTSETETGYESTAYKFFDFSNRDSLFLGGYLGALWTEEDGKELNVCNNTEKYNGTINFAGKYNGKVVFDNVTFVDKHKHYYYDSTYNEQEDYWGYNDSTESITYKITGGSFYVQSVGGEKISLPDSLLYDFASPYSDSTVYPEGQITVNKMPAVPSAPNGSLNNHSGNNHTVNNENMNDFYRAFMLELSRYGAPRAVNEGKGTEEYLLHGKKSGYVESKGERTFQRNNSGHYSSGTGKTEYHDYSNTDSLYFGGGVGTAGFGHYNYNSSGSNETSETIINGKIKFNGKFQGELVFDNFRYKYEYGSGINYESRYTHLSGSVRIGTINVTDKYLEYVIKGN